MLPQVKTSIQKLEKYKGIISDSIFEEINDLAENFKGLKVVHINSTPRGGGVAEVLKSLVPLMKGMGMKAEWHTIPPREDFFEITKKIHNALQGQGCAFPAPVKKRYLEYTKETAELARDMKADIWIIHDPQPVAMIDYLPDFYPAISRIHIDTSDPNPKFWNFIKRYLIKYNKIIFSAEEFVHNEIPEEKIVIFPPAIDPLSEKNIPLKLEEARVILKSFGVDTAKPLVSQVLRFDPWKDPIGSIKAYKIAKRKIPDLQLLLSGLFLANDDPEAKRVFQEVKKRSKGDSDIFLFSNPNQLGSLRVDRFINACQIVSDVVLQKSIREGFGLVVTEAMWKGKAVVGGNAGGIKLQIEDGKNGFLVSSPEQAAQRIIELIENSKLREKLGKAAKETVKEKFLMPRLLRDYLKLFKELV